MRTYGSQTREFKTVFSQTTTNSLIEFSSIVEIGSSCPELIPQWNATLYKHWGVITFIWKCFLTYILLRFLSFAFLFIETLNPRNFIGFWVLVRELLFRRHHLPEAIFFKHRVVVCEFLKPHLVDFEERTSNNRCKKAKFSFMRWSY